MLHRALPRLAVAVLCSYLATACATSKVRFEAAREVDTIAAYDEFLALGPTAEYAAKARARLEELHFADAKAANTVEALERFLERFPQGASSAAATELLAELTWSEVGAAPAVASCEAFLARFASFSRAGEVRAALDDAVWRETVGAGTAEAWLGYLERFAEGRHTSEARARGDEVVWAAAAAAPALESHEKYLTLFPEGAHRSEALADVAGMIWNAAESAGHAKSLYEIYAKRFPDGEHAAEAADCLAWADAETTGTRESLQAYVEAYPRGRFSEHATELLRDVLVPAPDSVRARIDAEVRETVDQSFDNSRGNLGGFEAFTGTLTTFGGTFQGTIEYSGTAVGGGKYSITFAPQDGSTCRFGNTRYVLRGGVWYPDFDRWFH